MDAPISGLRSARRKPDSTRQSLALASRCHDLRIVATKELIRECKREVQAQCASARRVDIDLRIAAGRPLAQWPRSEGKASRLRSNNQQPMTETQQAAQRAAMSAGQSGGGVAQRTQPIVREKVVGRNDPCPCGSGKKFKQCHGKLA